MVSSGGSDRGNETTVGRVRRLLEELEEFAEGRSIPRIRQSNAALNVSLRHGHADLHEAQRRLLNFRSAFGDLGEVTASDHLIEGTARADALRGAVR